MNIFTISHSFQPLLRRNDTQHKGLFVKLRFSHSQDNNYADCVVLFTIMLSVVAPLIILRSLLTATFCLCEVKT